MNAEFKEKTQRMGLIEFKAPFIKGNGTHYNALLSVSEYARGDSETLKRVSDLFPLVKDRLHHARSSTEITVFDPMLAEEAKVDSRHLYTYDGKGVLTIPWKMDILAIGREVIVAYEADIRRPDDSYGYRVVSTAVAEFNNDFGGHISPKNRMQVSALPVYLRLDSYDRRISYGPAIPRTISVYSRGEKLHHFEVADGNMMHVNGQRQFEGTWAERWHVGHSDEKSKVNMVEVRLKGNWQ